MEQNTDGQKSESVKESNKSLGPEEEGRNDRKQQKSMTDKNQDLKNMNEQKTSVPGGKSGSNNENDQQNSNAVESSETVPEGEKKDNAKHKVKEKTTQDDSSHQTQSENQTENLENVATNRGDQNANTRDLETEELKNDKAVDKSKMQSSEIQNHTVPLDNSLNENSNQCSMRDKNQGGLSDANEQRKMAAAQSLKSGSDGKFGQQSSSSDMTKSSEPIPVSSGDKDAENANTKLKGKETQECASCLIQTGNQGDEVTSVPTKTDENGNNGQENVGETKNNKEKTESNEKSDQNVRHDNKQNEACKDPNENAEKAGKGNEDGSKKLDQMEQSDGSGNNKNTDTRSQAPKTNSVSNTRQNAACGKCNNCLAASKNVSDEKKKKEEEERLSRPIMVCFHVALSPDFIAGLDKYDLHIHFFGSQFKERSFQLNIEREISNNLHLFSREVKFQYRDFYDSAPIEYKYKFVNKSDHRKRHYENSFTKSYLNNRQMDNRLILQTFDSSQRNSTEFIWHQFDGITRPKKDVYEKIKNFFSKLVIPFLSKTDSDWWQSYEALALMLLPDWKGLCLVPSRTVSYVAEEVLEKAVHVFGCISHYFLDADGHIFSKNDTDKMVRSYLLSQLDTAKRELESRGDSDQNCRSRLAKFVSIVHIIITFGVELKKEYTELICRGLLLKPDFSTNSCPDYEELLAVHFKNISEQIKKSILVFVNKYASKISAQWILVLPLIHFLSKASEPFRELCYIQGGYDHQSGQWWGEKEIQDAKGQLKFDSGKKLQTIINENKEQLAALFEVDKMLPRTLLALMQLEDSLELLPEIQFPSNASIANIRYFLKSCPEKFNSDDKLQKLKRAMQILSQRVEKEDGKLSEVSSSNIEWKLDCSLELYEISLDLLDIVCAKVVSYHRLNWKVVLWAVELFFSSCKHYSQLLDHPLVKEHFESMQKSSSSSSQLVGHGTQKVLGCLQNLFRGSMDEQRSHCTDFQYNLEPQFLSALFNLTEKLWDKELKAEWTKSFEDYLKSRIQKMKPETIVTLTVDHDFTQYNCSVIENIFTECVLKAADEVCKDMNMDYLVNNLQRHSKSDKMFYLMSKLFLRAWPEDDHDSLNILNHVLSWSPFVDFLKMFDSWNSSGFSDLNCSEHISNVKRKLRETMSQLLDGSIIIRELKVLLEPKNRKQMIVIINKMVEDRNFLVISTGHGMTVDHALNVVLSWRRLELEEYLRQYDLVKSFLDHCRAVKTDDVISVVESLSDDVDHFPLAQLCKTRLLTPLEPGSVDQNVYYQPKISHFLLSEKTLKTLEEVKQLKNSKWFFQQWDQFLTKTTDESQIDDVDADGRDLSLRDDDVIYGEMATVEVYDDNEVDNENDEDNDDDVPLSVGDENHDEDDNEDDDLPLRDENGDETLYSQVIHRFLKSVFFPSKEMWTQHVNEIVSGQITIKAMEKVLQDLRNDHNQLKFELEFLIKDDDKIQERLNQVKLLQEVNFVTFGAEVMLKAKEKFDLQGDFSDLEVLMDMASEKSNPLSSITQTLVDSVEVLRKIDDVQAKCLDVFIENKVLADWLKDTVAPDEIRTFIDIALIVAADEGAVQVEYVTCLDAVIKGFAPLIYEVKEDMCYEDFLQLCAEVWEALKAAPDLPENFEAAAKSLEFLKQIQESHGSVEDGAISLTRFINQTGVFTVGFHQGKTFKELKDVISLKYTKRQLDKEMQEQHTAVAVREMDLMKLTNLNNKLMLIVLRDEDVKIEGDQFCQIFDGILRLSKTYVKLCTTGCSLFHRWKAVFCCDPNKKNKVYIDFGGDDLTLKSGDKNAVNNILEICQFMESCLEDWLKYVEEQREKCCYLNFFTTQQLMILQRELSKIKNGLDVELNNVASLLSLVKRNCSHEDICRSISIGSLHLEEQEKVTDLEKVDEAQEMLHIHENEEEEEEEDEVTSAHLDFIKAMIENDFSRALAMKAIADGIDPSNISDGILWCMENQELSETLSPSRESYGGQSLANESFSDANSELNSPEQELSGAKEPSEVNSLAMGTSKLLQNLVNSDDPLLVKLQDVWRGFLTQTTQSYSDCLSLRHVGSILKNLAQADDEDLVFLRPMPTYLKTSQPNLILCSKSDVLSAVLSIYAFKQGVALPLPSVDEVLLCSSETSAEDVELLFRRALENRNKIYCLVHADLLDYEVACQVEEQILRFFPSSNIEGLRLVVICCTERRSNIVSALDRYRVPLPSFDHNDLKQYLKNHFTSDSVGKFGATARDVDPEQCGVRMVQSDRSGVGKTLYVRRLKEALQKKLEQENENILVTVSLHSRIVDHSEVMKKLLNAPMADDMDFPRIFHIDVAPEVHEGVDHLLFSLLVLGYVSDENGFVFGRREEDLYVIECMPQFLQTSSTKNVRYEMKPRQQLVHQIFSLLPSITCWSPQDSLDILNERTQAVQLRHPELKITKYDPRVDMQEFVSEKLQRPFQYLKRYSTKSNVQRIKRIIPEGTPAECIECLLRHCGVNDPSWSELHNFASFLNIQLKDCENSVYCSEFLSDDLPGFFNFVIKFMIRMSKDFATRSLMISEETPGSFSHGTLPMLLLYSSDEIEEIDEKELLERYAMKRRWETSPHPYLFFNFDRNSFTFMGFVVERQTQNLLDPQTKSVIENRIMPQNLHQALYRNNVNLQEDFESLSREQKINKLCYVMGQDSAHDPDETYELTADNVKKILAIFMRFRCRIPVIIMGETGCGKTRLIKFMCDLWRNRGEEMENMILMKMHGGTTEEDIMKNLEYAITVAKENHKNNPKFGTVLFFDEANTTEAIGLIKEIMCDHTCNGKPVPYTEGLHLIAACNPYRKHTDVMIDRLEQAGLGYRVRAEETKDKLGYIPLRQLVYRVQVLPQSMLPLVWDFGQLSDDIELLYIRQMVKRHLKERHHEFILFPQLEATVTKILAASQAFMRIQKDECSFVSLRDVERTLQVMMWFYVKGEFLFKLMNEEANRCPVNGEFFQYQAPSRIARSLILALGVCYHACLQNRAEYREHISQYFVRPCALNKGAATFLKEINLCQDVFLDNIGKLGDNIARNKALKENVFMMVVCIELRIPLFLVGKPGSSKSLAKTIVGNGMLGKASSSQLFKAMKSVHMVSFQCSPLSTPEGIIGIFEQCARLQNQKDLDKYVAVVVLDEVGLAEDSPKMPLKTLHPLLEYGCEVDGQIEKHSKVGFIGISNWALDPAKMNRGILVLREVPDEEELLDSAKGICAGEYMPKMIDLLPLLTSAYRELYDAMLDDKREFFGLRDFYSLVKMVYAFCKKSNCEPTWHELKHAILRNFDGLDDVNALKIFEKHLSSYAAESEPLSTDPDCSSSALIKAGLHGIGLDSESRYLLIITENYVALGLLQQQLEDLKDAVTIFGSSFPKDQEYTQVCRNINRIKTFMENGRTVVLLNLENLYESLYDALNQYYMYFNKQRFVDLGLGTQRVKCKVHEDFRLIVVAEKEVVYKKFPIPLLNRLEKHILSMQTMLTKPQMKLVRQLDSWAKDVCDVESHGGFNKRRPTVGDVFIGYHDDTPASIILQLWKQNDSTEMDRATEKRILNLAKSVLLHCATPDSLIRLSGSRLAADKEKIQHEYFVEQCHNNLAELLKQESAICGNFGDAIFMQITTHSHLLSKGDLLELSNALDVDRKYIHLHSLQEFDTEQQFCSLLKDVFRQTMGEGDADVLTANDSENDRSLNHANHLFVLQCDSGDANAELIACARYNIFSEFSQVFESQSNGYQSARICIVFIIQLPRIPGGCFAGFQVGKWKCYHLDELLPAKEYIPSLSTLMELRISELLQQKLFDDDLENVEKTEELKELSMVQRGSDDRVSRIEEDLLKFDVESLILSCLHRSAALLKDFDDSAKARNSEDLSTERDSSNRKFHRLELLLKLLPNSRIDQGKTSLMSVIKSRLSRLMRDKETSNQTPEQAGNWLRDEVSTLEATAKAGSFRRSLLQTVETKVTPLLSGIIAYADKNANLDLLQSVSPWKQALWLNMFSEEEVTLFRFRDLNSSDHRHFNAEFPEFHVTNTGCDGRFFQCSFPFSWVVKDQVDSLIQQAKQSGKLLDDLVALLENTELGKILSTSIDEESRTEAFDAYLTDFVQMVFKSKSCSEAEIKWVTEDLQRTMMQGQNSQTTDLLHRFVEVHLAYDVARPRVKSFAEFIRIWPECKQFLDKETDESLSLDVRMLSSVLRYLTPEPPKKDTPTKSNDTKSDDPKYWSRWAEKADVFYPLIQQLINSFDTRTDDSGNRQAFESCCQRWNRFHALQLYIKRVCLSEMTDHYSLVVPNYQRLFQLLGDKADFKQIKTFKFLETFVNSSNKQATKYFIDLGECGHCTKPVNDPVELPCKHTICLNCIHEVKQMNVFVCPRKDCNKKFPQNLKIEPLKTKRKEIIAHDEYRKCLNSFYMGVIHSLCFLRNSPPSDEVIKKLMELVTLGAKETFEEKADPSPVIRSFVLQVLLQSKIENVRNYLAEYFSKARETLKTEEEEFLDLCVLIVNCVEDYYRSLGCMKNSFQEELKFVSELLESVKPDQRKVEGTPSTDDLELFGKIRFILNRVATWIHQMHILNHKDMSRNDIWPFLRKLSDYLHAEGSKWPGIYLMRVITNNYGLEILRQLATTPQLHWIFPPDARKELQTFENYVPDKFLIYGENYKHIRDQIYLTTLGKGTDALRRLYESVEKTEKLLVQSVLLAVYRSMTLNYRHSDEKKRTEKAKKCLMDYCTSLPVLKSQDLVTELVENKLPGSLLLVSSDKSPRQLTLAELMTHFYVVMSTLKDQKLLSPFTSLIFNPDGMKNSLLPTMPQDDLERFKLLIAEKENAATVYKCPNGHPYIIGDCGNPNSVRSCPDCGLEIGGINHKLKPGNVKLQTFVDETRTGHCIGPAQLRGEVPLGERDLTPAEAALIRLLLHMSLYIGSASHSQGVCGLITPEILENQVQEYFHHHIAADLRHIGTTLGKNEDDVYLLVHLMLHEIASGKPLQSGPHNLPVLVTKDERQLWENLFVTSYITPILQKLNQGVFTAYQETVRKDDILFGNSPLIQMLFEADCEPRRSEDEDNASQLWQFRSQISLENLAQQLSGNVTSENQNQKQLPILRLLLREKHRLHLLQLLPNVVKLNQLMRRHLLKQSREAASKWTVGSREFKESFSDNHLFEEIENLIKDFAVAWKELQQNLSSFVFSGTLRLTEDQRNQLIDGSTMISTFLPSSRGDGLRSVALVSCLCDIQNKFMEEYSQLSRQSLETSVDVDEANVFQIVTFHEQEILPLLLANSAYSLKAGEGTSIRYDFTSLEKQIEERFIRGKPRLRPYQVDQLITLDEGSYVKLFKQLRQRVHQEPLPSQLRPEVFSMKKDYSMLNSLIADLDTVLGYLAFIGGKPTQPLQQFMSSVLQMEPKMKSTKVQTICLKHFESLWLALSFMKAKLVLGFKQEPFELVDGKYREALTEQMSSDLKNSLLGVGDIDLLALSLFECILFHIAVGHSDTDEGNCDEDLDLILNTYVEQKTGNFPEWKFPKEIKVKHCLDAWRHLVQFQPKRSRN